MIGQPNKIQRSTVNDKIEIWMIEDDPELRLSYMALINTSGDFYVSKSFRSAEEAIDTLSPRNKPSILLMDIQLPGMNGVRATRIVKTKYPEIVIIIVTVFEDSEQVFNSLKSGASGYITKSSDYIQLINAVREINSGGAPISSKIAKMVIDSFHKNSNSPLSQRETEILQFVSSGKTFGQIASQLSIARETIKTHVRNIYRKLEVDCRADAIAKATKAHYI